jgi:hypothetical protein
MTLPDTASFEFRDYKMKLTADMIGRPTIGAQVGGYYGNGLYGGSFIALSDMLGNHNLVLAGNVSGSLNDASFYTGYAFLKRRANFTVALQQIPLYRYLSSDVFASPEKGREQEDVVANVFLRDVIRSAQAMVSYPFSQYQRIELGASGVYYKEDLLYRGYYVGTNDPLEQNDRLNSLAYWQPRAALVYDNSLFGWTGPVFGRRYRIELSRPMGDFQFTEALIDFRNYANFKQSIILATRFTALSRTGRDADRFLLYWGGPYFIRGYDAGSFELQGDECTQSREAEQSQLSSCPVRDQLIGSSAAFFNAELRFPLVKQLQIGFLGSFPPVDFVTFIDGGAAWNGDVCAGASLIDPRECESDLAHDVHLVWKRKPGQDPVLWREPVFSYGFGLRLNIFYTVLRFDYAIPMNRPARNGLRDGIFSVSFGPSF